MRPIRSLLVYLALVFVGGALLAPWLYKLTAFLAASSPSFENLAASPLHRFVNRSLLGLALLGLWPLLRCCRMARWRDLGLGAGCRSAAGVAYGFLLGFGSLACVALLAIFLGGRSFNAAHSGAQVLGHVMNAALAAVLVAIMEEIVFRGTLFGILRKALSWPMALVLSSAFYALVHFIQSADTTGPVGWLSGLTLLGKMFQSGPPLIPAVLTLFMAGASLALAYQRTGTLFFSMGLHAGWIFWLKSYGFFSAKAPGANPLIWGTDRLIDGWLALPILGGVLWIVSRMKLAGEKQEGPTA